MRRRVWKHLGLGALLVLAAMQVSRPDMTKPPTDPAKTLDALYPPPPEVTGLLVAACYDCHSHETRWPWYAHVAPVSWFVARDVVRAREHMNFSTFGDEVPEDRAAYLEECAEKVREHEMPPTTYTWLHAAARLPTKERERLAGWFEEAAQVR